MLESLAAWVKSLLTYSRYDTKARHLQLIPLSFSKSPSCFLNSGRQTYYLRFWTFVWYDCLSGLRSMLRGQRVSSVLESIVQMQHTLDQIRFMVINLTGVCHGCQLNGADSSSSMYMLSMLCSVISATRSSTSPPCELPNSCLSMS